ncbi:hypothetical protein DDZ15_08110 [Rhodohalobacter mucosus]|uniref:Uncharacterized protein n=1 Tax=Rhodohalobacter mucosus TaxID=2079485 RepID=A0A316U0Y4_9BACT|nr:hypothetical protein DDZ15_08110 [Rhodohalobacter mucosus]
MAFCLTDGIQNQPVPFIPESLSITYQSSAKKLMKYSPATLAIQILMKTRTRTRKQWTDFFGRWSMIDGRVSALKSDFFLQRATFRFHFSYYIYYNICSIKSKKRETHEIL